MRKNSGNPAIPLPSGSSVFAKTYVHLVLCTFYSVTFTLHTQVANVVLTGRPGGEESVHYSCPWHLDHSELLTPDISLHSDDHSCSKPENDLMDSWTSKHGYVKIHFILVLKCVSSCQLYIVHSYSESKVLISFDATVYMLQTFEIKFGVHCCSISMGAVFIKKHIEAANFDIFIYI